MMRIKHTLLSTAASLAVALATSGLGPAAAQAEPGLSGQVTAPTGPMEGVLVTAKKNGSTIAYTVVSDARGRYSFPAGKIEGGEYTLRIRATAAELDGASRDGALQATIDPQKPTTVDLKTKKTRNLPAQLVNAEWIMSVPGTDDQKAQLLNCVGCHTLERIVRSTHNADEFTQVIHRMANYAQVSQPIKPQRRMDPEWAPKPE
ncbi:MAG TPA: carboxypeptidase-like regulatory domain-containing protein, partial [Xanthobacteraceae bacterium]|nr:carboxypeptidase-like regulatory domain-containing protein [Xanthobacteraceae bacterium]